MPPKQDASFPNSLQLCAVYRNSGFCKNSHCRRLHLCPNWLAGYCKAEANCKLVHSTRTPHNTQILKHYMPRLSPSCELLRHKFVLKHAFVRPCTHYWRGKCRFGPATCRNLHCCPSTARGLSCHKGAQCHLSHQINREALKRRKINIPDGFKDVQVAWHYVVVSDPYNEAKLRQAHACDCNRCRKAASAAGGDAPPVASRAESVASASSLGELDGDDGSEEADAASYGDFEDFGVDDSEGEAERTLQAAAAAAAALEEADGEGPLMQEPEREHNSSHGISNDKSYLDDMESPLSTMKLPRNIAGPPSEDKSELYKDKNLDFENVFRHIRSAPLLTLDNVVSFLLTAGGSASVPEFLERFALQSSFPLEQWLSEQPEGRLILREGRLNAYPSVRVCQFYNGVKEGCRNARCERLHVCLWWLADPDGLVHKGKCGLAHGLQDARNKELLARLGLGGVSSQKLLELVRASHPAVCSKYNADSGCDLAECPDIHICNNALHRENKLAKQLCPCARRHVLEPADKDPQTAAKLARFGLQDGNLNFIVRSFLVPAPLRNTLPDMAGDSAPKSAPPSAPPSAPSSATCLPPTLPDVSARGLGLRPAYNALIRRGGQATPSELLADLKLPSDFPLEQWRDDIDELIKPVQSMIDIYKDGGSGQAVSVNVFRRFRICAMHNGAPNSCQKADCSQLHLCLWYLADPEGKVQDKKKCQLTHDFSSRNHRIRYALGLGDGYKQAAIVSLLRNCHPNVCVDYNTDSGCSRPDCPYIHVCNNSIRCGLPSNKKKRQTAAACNCQRQHRLEQDSVAKLRPYGLDEEKLSFVFRSYLVPAPLSRPDRIAAEAATDKPADVAKPAKPAKQKPDAAKKPAKPNKPEKAAKAAAKAASPTSATCLPPTLPDVSARGLGLRPAYNALIRRGGQATPSDLLADLKLPSDFPLERWRDDIDELIKPVQSMIDIYKDGGSGQAVSVNVFRRFRICAMHNGAPNSCQKADCSQLHLCLWYLADPEGKVHDKSQCNLVHDLSGRNHRIRSALGIADGLKQREVLDLLRASHPKVCAAYNSDSGCPRPVCPDIHLCNNVLFKHSGRCNCSRGHVLTMDAATKEKLFPFDMEELDPGQVLRSFLVPAPLPNTNPNPAPAAASRSKPAAPDASDVRGSGDRVDSGQAAAPPLMRQPLVAGPSTESLQSAMQQQRQPRKPTPDLQNQRQKKLAANSVPNLAKINLSGQPSKSARGRRPQQQRQRDPSGASAAAAAAAAAPAAPPGGPASEGALCEEFLRHECFSQNCRQLHSRLKAPYLWQWRAARSSPNDWKDVDSALNERLEAAFCHPERSEFVTVGGGVGGELGSEFPGQLTFSFVAMEIRGISGPPGGLRCLRTASRAVLRRPLATKWRWFFLTDTGAWATVELLHEPSLNDKLEEALCRGDSSLTVGDFSCNFGQMLLSVPGSPQPVPLRRRPIALQQPQNPSPLPLYHSAMYQPGVFAAQPPAQPAGPAFAYPAGFMGGWKGPGI